jgi:hydroxymethylbilane synthase
VSSIETLPRHAKLGTASPRRAAQVKRLRPDVTAELIRGNIETRLKKVLDEKRFDATLLAVAGLKRGGLAKHAAHAIEPEVLLPAAGQGALALQCRADDHVTLTRCLPLNHAPTATAVHAERAIVAGLGGDCHAAIAALAEVSPAEVRVRVRVLSADGSRVVEADQTAPIKRATKLAGAMLKDLEARGARELLRG